MIKFSPKRNLTSYTPPADYVPTMPPADVPATGSTVRRAAQKRTSLVQMVREAEAAERGVPLDQPPTNLLAYGMTFWCGATCGLVFTYMFGISAGLPVLAVCTGAYVMWHFMRGGSL